MGKRITRNRRLTVQEKAKYRTIREQVAEELPEIKRRGKAAKQGILLKHIVNALKEDRQR